jgi:hypothetical protein
MKERRFKTISNENLKKSYSKYETNQNMNELI